MNTLKYCSYPVETIFNQLQTEEDMILLSMVINLLPGIGDGVGVWSSLTGHDIITGDPLAWWEVILGLLCLSELRNIDSFTDMCMDINRAGDVLRGIETASEAIERTGLSAEKFTEILNTAKGLRPDPSTYLKADYISSHLAKFEGGVTKISASAPTGVVGPPGGTFVMPKSLADEMIAKTGGNVSKLEELLSLEPGTLSTNPVRIDISSPSGLRMPSGNELGANSQWLPGGYTGGGILEATIDPAQIGTYIVMIIFN